MPITRSRGFTLIEILVSVSIIAMLASVVLVSLTSTRESARIAAILEFSNSIYHRLGSNITGYWNFENNSWNDVNNVNNPDPGNSYSASLGTNGVSGGDLFLDYGYITIPDSSTLPGKSGAITIESWFFDPTNSSLIIAKDPNRDPNYTWTLGLNLVGYPGVLNIRWQVYTATGGLCYFLVPVSQTAFVPGKWNHVVGSYDGVSKLRLWVDSREITPTLNGTCSGPISGVANAGGLQIGSGNSEGYVDNVRLYDEAMPQ